MRNAAPSATFDASAVFPTGLAGSVGVRIIDTPSTTVITARTTSGVSEVPSGSGLYYKTLTAPSTVGDYSIIWDAAGDYAQEDLTVALAVAPSTISGGDANGTLTGLTFLIKRGDTLPYLRRQLLDAQANIVPLDPTDTVKFTMRVSSDVAMAGSAKVHASAVIVDATQGVVEYRWAAGDTDTSTYTETSTLGRPVDVPYAAEFELTRVSDGKIETFPQATYIAVSIPPDLDPGVNP